MPRPARLDLTGIPQHIRQGGNNRQVCFFAEAADALHLSLHPRTPGTLQLQKA